MTTTAAKEKKLKKLTTGEDKVTYYGLFQYATLSEKAATVLAVLLSFLSGSGITIDMSVMGEMSTAFVERTHPPADRLSTHLPILSKFGGGRRLLNSTHEENMAALLEDGLAYVKCSALVTTSGFLLVTSSVVLVSWSALRQITTIRMRFLKSVLHQDMSWFDMDNELNLATAMSENTTKIKNGMSEKLVSVSNLFGTVVFSVYVPFAIGWELSLACAAVMPFALAASVVLYKYQIKSATYAMESYSLAGKLAEEVLKSVKTVVAFGGESVEVNRYRALLEPAERYGRGLGLFNGLGIGFNWIMMFCVTSIALSYGARLILWDMSKPAEEQRYVYGTFYSIDLNMFAATQILSMCLPHLEVFATARGAAACLFQIIKRVPKVDSCDAKSASLPEVLEEIIFQNVDFSYPSRPDIKVLNDFSLHIKRGQYVALIGPSGCGKTTVLQLLQRLYDPTSGSVTFDGNEIRTLNLSWLRSILGVVGQEPVLFSGTIFENIAIGNPEATLDQVQSVAHTANAHKFITNFPKGYETMIGERGASLSGGQKQRIAIARALLRSPAVLLLDEPTSALDARAEAQVQAALERARPGRTTIVVSHRLSTIVNADRIICMNKGIIVEQGTHEELMTKKGFYYKFLTVNNNNKENMKLNKEFESTLAELQCNTEIKTVNKNKNRRVSKQSLAKVSVEDGDEDIPALSGWEILKLNAPEWVLLTIGSVAAFIQGSNFSAIALLTGYTSAIFVLEDQDQILYLADLYAVLFLVVACVSGACMCIQSYAYTTAGIKMTSRVRMQYFTALMKQEIAFYDKPSNTVGALCSRLSSDTADMQNATGMKVGIILQGISSVLVGLCMSMFFDWRLTLVLSTVLPLMVGSTWLEGQLSQSSHIAERVALEDASSVATEAIISIKTIQSLGLETTFLDKFQKSLNKACTAIGGTAYLRGFVMSMGLYTPLWCCCCCFYYGSTLVANGLIEYKVILLERSTPKVISDLAASVNNPIIGVTESIVFSSYILSQTLSYTSSFNKVGISAGRILSVINREPAVRTHDDVQDDKDWSATGNLNFNEIKFTYPTRNMPEVLRGIDLNIKAGTTVALVGSSGCGKSTILQLMQRFYDPDTGTIKLDGLDTRRSLSLPQLRQQLGVVQQEPVLLDRTLAENVAYGDNTRRVHVEEVIAACKAANIHAFIMSLPKGYDTRLGSGGAQLSGGQKQRVCIARALVRAPRLLLLDEATSALDANSEWEVSEALDEAAKGRTCVIIAHRLSTVENADLIFVLNEGKIVEQGTHRALIAAKGLYYRMYREQTLV